MTHLRIQSFRKLVPLRIPVDDVKCIFKLVVESESVVAQGLTLWDPMECSLSGSSVHGIFPGKSAGVDCHFLRQGIFLTQESNPGLPHCRQMLYRLSHQGVLGYIKIISPLLELNLQICPLSVPPPTFWVLTPCSARLSSFSLKSWKLPYLCWWLHFICLNSDTVSLCIECV